MRQVQNFVITESILISKIYWYAVMFWYLCNKTKSKDGQEHKILQWCKQTNTTCRINHAYALFLKILMHDFDVVVRKLCWEWNIFLLWNAEIEIYCYLNNSYTATIIYQHSLIYVNIYAAVKMKELFGRFDFNRTA